MADDLGRAFDAIAEAYARAFADELERKPFDRELGTRFASTLPAGATVLDIGTTAISSFRFGNTLDNVIVKILGFVVSDGDRQRSSRQPAARRCTR